MSESLGAQSLFYAELVGQKWFARNGDLQVFVEREATLSRDLAQINSRLFRHIRAYVGRDFKVRLSREEARWLRDSLSLALERTDGMADA